MEVPLYRWMVYNGNSSSKMDDLGVRPLMEKPHFQTDLYISQRRSIHLSSQLSIHPFIHWLFLLHETIHPPYVHYISSYTPLYVQYIPLSSHMNIDVFYSHHILIWIISIYSRYSPIIIFPLRGFVSHYNLH